MKKTIQVPTCFSVLEAEAGVVLVAQPQKRQESTITESMWNFMLDNKMVTAFEGTDKEGNPGTIFVRWATPKQIAEAWEKERG